MEAPETITTTHTHTYGKGCTITATLTATPEQLQRGSAALFKLGRKVKAEEAASTQDEAER